MTPNEYQQAAARTDLRDYTIVGKRILEPDGFRRLIHSQLGVSSESGELADAIKKFIIYGKELDIENIKEEYGDLLWYINIGLTSIGYTMEECMQANIDKLKLRYPEKFTEKDALERKDKL